MLSKRIIENIRKSNKENFYIYDLDRLELQLEKFSCLPKNIRVFFAMKANPNKKIVEKVIKNKNIFGLEIASKGEAEKILTDNANLEKVIFTGPAKTSEEIEFVLRNNIKAINVESLTEAHRINNICRSLNKKQNILLRININQEIHGSGKMSFVSEPSAFGVEESSALEILEKIKLLKNINIIGIHTYSATGVLDFKELTKLVEYTFILSNKLENETNLKFTTVDFGGGFGIDYFKETEFNIVEYAKELEKLIKKYKFENKELFLELGRFICADMGYFVTRIVDIKKSKGAKVVTCSAGINAHRRPSLFGPYPTTIIPMQNKLIHEDQVSLAETDYCLICGPLCTSADTLSKGIVNLKQKANIGDYLVQSKAGAYGISMSITKFLSHPEVEEIILE